MFQIKICGITNPSDARMAAEAGADAIGLNFYPSSPRYVEPRVAETIIAALPSHMVKVGVYVNAPADKIRSLFDRLRLDLVQLHGDEPPEFIAELEGRPVMRAFRCGDNFSAVGEYLGRCEALGCRPRMAMVDALRPGQYGGTGAEADWGAIARARAEFGDLPLVLAGGLTPENVANAIAAVKPDAVDTASGVELSPGKKSLPRVQAFVQAARAAMTTKGPNSPRNV